MKIARFSINGQRRLGYLESGMLMDCGDDTLESLVRADFDLSKIGDRAIAGRTYPVDAVRFELPVASPSKNHLRGIELCRSHSRERFQAA